MPIQANPQIAADFAADKDRQRISSSESLIAETEPAVAAKILPPPE
jgi:hypothetical protein